MPKVETLLLPENIYHIYNHANGWEDLFRNEGNYAFFLRRYAYFIKPIAETYAYCLMPNHFHLLVKIKSEADLKAANIFFQTDRNIAPANIKQMPKNNDFPKFVSRVFGNLFSSYTQAYNKQQKRRGGLFIQSFKRIRVDSDNYFTRLIYYIHNNPVHHKFVEDMEDWNFSSYNLYLSDTEKDSDREKILDSFRGLAAFKAYHQGKIEAIKEIEF